MHSIDVTDLANMKLEWRLRVANPEANSISHLHRFGRNLYVVWKDKEYGTKADEFGGFQLTTLALP